MVVQQHILNWLYSILTSEYHDVNRTYNDVAQVLSQYPSLSPRTDVHTFPNGASALLLHLSGTIPVVFRGATYRFPISIWIPHAYPREAPLVYVTPTDTMIVRPGQHVDPQGQVYHPYLVGWAEFWDKSSLLDFLAILRDVFSKEPPVIARQQPQRPAPPPQQHIPTPPPVPPLPQELSARPPSTVQSPAPSQTAPPPPPKPHEQAAQAAQVARPPPPPGPRDTAPPLPPLPPGHPNNRFSRYESAPPLPPQPEPLQQAYTQPGPSPPGPRPPYQPPQGPYGGGPVSQSFSPADPRQMSTFSPHLPYTGPPPPWQQQQQPPPVSIQPNPKPPPPPDLMDEPLTLTIPTSAVTAPPIPPNPEKDAMLHQLAQTLYEARQRTHGQNASSLSGLQAQRTAMLNAFSTMQAELSQLTQLSALLQSNTTILRDTMRRADGVIESSALQPAPAIDDLLVAPTVVGNQLYELVAEERALADAIFVVGRSVERGKVSPAVFAKTTRSLAREWYLKKALVKKIGRGMGLAS
ncbi:ESCRT-I component [Pleurostoma richardsiae]|uniref:ESCRT-I component n=1 Tax=Pleurostoma richardsiae TaxID=41990 RepID=A0AA38S0J5_9PEZI|nr:ESCRT-I component [Pleurostoma richardsiae]